MASSLSDGLMVYDSPKSTPRLTFLWSKPCLKEANTSSCI